MASNDGNRDGVVELRLGPPVSGASFYGRGRLVDSLWSDLTEKRNLLLIAPRRVGKTSVMHHLRDHPRPGWNVAFVDVQNERSASGILAAVVEAMKEHSRIGRRFLNGLRALTQSLPQLDVSAFGVRVALQQATGDDWPTLAKGLTATLRGLVSDEERFLLVIDEFPIALAAILGAAPTDTQRAEAAQILRLLRSLRMAPDLIGRFQMVLGGSIGLDPVLRRHRISGDANDLARFPVGPWSRETALGYMTELGIPEPLRHWLLRFAGEQPIPYHLVTMIDGARKLDGELTEVTEGDLEDIFHARLSQVGLDHYVERLDTVLEAGAVEAAYRILGRLARDGWATRADLLISAGDQGARTQAREALRVLLDDGYLRREADQVTFANPFIKVFWSTYLGAGT